MTRQYQKVSDFRITINVHDLDGNVILVIAGVEEVRRVLDEALFKKQLDIDNKLRKLEEVKHKKEGKKQVEKLYNEKLHLHEAFQYLMRKYSAEAEKYRKQAEESAGGGVEEELSSTNSDAACTELKYFHELSIDN